MVKAAFESVVFFFLAGLMLFGSAHRLDWPMAWAFMLVNVVFMVVGFLLLPPDLIKERSRLTSGGQPLDLIIAGLMGFFLMPVTWIVCGLDARFRWSPAIPTAIQWAALSLFIIGNGIGLWAARTNRFLSTVVRIQSERGHYVVDSGPYAYVRHPAYGGWLVAYLALPIALGSLWGLIPAALGVVFMVLRTLYEEATLADELRGYGDYMRKVRWRLVPGIW